MAVVGLVVCSHETALARGAFPKCKPAQYAYVPGVNGAEGTVVLQAPVVYRSGPTCRLVERVVVRLADARGHLLKVRGDPAHVVVDAVVGRRRVFQFRGVALGWHNWCAQGPSAFSFRVTSPTKAVEFRWHPAVPVCIDPAAPSVLRRFTHRG
jgi:hypothetical protein